MAITLANNVSVANITGSSVSTLACAARNMTTGNLIVVGVRSRSTTSSVSDTAGNTYTHIDNRSSMGATDYMDMFYCANCTGNANNVVTAAFGASQSYVAVLVHEYTDANTLDQKTYGNVVSPATSVTTSAFTTTVADEVIVAMGSCDTVNLTFTAGATYTIRNTAGGMAMDENLIVSSTQTNKTASVSHADSHLWELSVATFYKASAGGGRTAVASRTASGSRTNSGSRTTVSSRVSV